MSAAEHFALFETDIGLCGLAWTDAGLTWVQLPEKDRTATEKRLAGKVGDANAKVDVREAPSWVRDSVALIREHLAGTPRDLSVIPLDVSKVTPLMATIARAACAIAPGSTTTYGTLAANIGAPQSSRVVGRAMATNRWPIVVPCHRVVAANGKKGGFSAHGGLLTKEKLLAIEGGALSRASLAPEPPSAQQSLFAATSESALPFDGAFAVATLARADSVLAKHMRKIGPLRLQRKDTEDTFAALAESIVYQQLSGRAAATIFGRVRTLFPRDHFDAEHVLGASDEALRGAGLSGAKLASLKDLAHRTIAGEIPTLAELTAMSDETIVERLTQVRGIGRWTVEMLLIFRLGRPDVLPISDYGIRKGFARLFTKGREKYRADELPTPSALTERADRWRPFRSVASWYLWRALDT